jgi:hypothetical protein
LISARLRLAARALRALARAFAAERAAVPAIPATCGRSEPLERGLEVDRREIGDALRARGEQRRGLALEVFGLAEQAEVDRRRARGLGERRLARGPTTLRAAGA